MLIVCCAGTLFVFFPPALKTAGKTHTTCSDISEILDKNTVCPVLLNLLTVYHENFGKLVHECKVTPAEFGLLSARSRSQCGFVSL